MSRLSRSGSHVGTEPREPAQQIRAVLGPVADDRGGILRLGVQHHDRGFAKVQLLRDDLVLVGLGQETLGCVQMLPVILAALQAELDAVSGSSLPDNFMQGESSKSRCGCSFH